MNTLENITTALKKAGMRLTPQRIAICKILIESIEHPTAGMVYDQLKAQYPSLSLMTVYNTLNKLVNLGVINSLGSAGDNNVHYDGNTSSHVNLACISCHKIIDTFMPQISDLETQVSSDSGYKLLGVRMMYYGICPECQSSTSNN